MFDIIGALSVLQCSENPKIIRLDFDILRKNGGSCLKFEIIANRKYCMVWHMYCF